MPWYTTEYIVGSGKYGDQLYAENDEQAEEIAARRGIGEKVISEVIKAMELETDSST